MNKNELRLVPYDASWKEDFLTERRQIEDIIADSYVRIEHISSTSIPTVYAKPILDTAILCEANKIEFVAAALIKLGYEYRVQFGEESGHSYAVLDKDNFRYCQMHIYTEASED